MNSVHQQQRPWVNSAGVRSAPSPQHGAHLDHKSAAARAVPPPAQPPAPPPEEKSFDPKLKR